MPFLPASLSWAPIATMGYRPGSPYERPSDRYTTVTTFTPRTRGHGRTPGHAGAGDARGARLISFATYLVSTPGAGPVMPGVRRAPRDGHRSVMPGVGTTPPRSRATLYTPHYKYCTRARLPMSMTPSHQPPRATGNARALTAHR